MFVWPISAKPHQRNLQSIVATAATGAQGEGATVVLEWGPLNRLQHPAVESQLCAPRGAVCWNDPCKSIRSFFGLQRWSTFTHAHGRPQLTSMLRIKVMHTGNRNAKIFLYHYIMSAFLHYVYDTIPWCSSFATDALFYHTFNVK